MYIFETYSSAACRLLSQALNCYLLCNNFKLDSLSSIHSGLYVDGTRSLAYKYLTFLSFLSLLLYFIKSLVVISHCNGQAITSAKERVNVRGRNERQVLRCHHHHRCALTSVTNNVFFYIQGIL